MPLLLSLSSSSFSFVRPVPPPVRYDPVSPPRNACARSALLRSWPPPFLATAPMKPLPPTLRVAYFLACFFVCPLVALAQTGTGIITGRVLNPATGEYLRNAEVRLQ